VRREMSISVGDFAEKLLVQGTVKAPQNTGPTLQPDPSVYSADVTAQAPDISHVEVPNYFVKSITESNGDCSKALTEVKVSVDEGVAPVDPQGSTEPLSEMTELKTLIQELKDMIIDVKNTLSEMTTVGAIGVNMAGPEDKKKKKKASTDVEDLLKKIRKKRAIK